MTLFFYYSTGDLGNQAVRLGSGFALAENAEAGTIGMSQVQVDDPGGALDLVGHKRFNVDETGCSWLRLFSGYFGERELSRADSLILGAARRWDCTVLDLNAALGFEVLRGDAANRPAETDVERITWWLSTAFTGPIANDLTFVSSSGPEDMDATDYRGRTGADLLADCAQMSQKNYFVAHDEPSSQVLLHYYAPSAATNSSTLRISNVRADVDSSTVFAPDRDAKLRRDPSRVFSGVYLAYGTGQQAVYESDSAIASAFAKRDTSIVDPTISTEAKATRKAQQYLTETDSEYDRIILTLRAVPAAQVNLIRVGQRIEVKFTHLPGYTSFTWIRIARRTVRQDGEVQGVYMLELELANAKIAPGGQSRHNPPGGSTDGPVPDIGTCTRAAATIGAKHNAKDALGVFSFGTGGSVVESAVTENTAYTTAGCLIGCGMYGPGTTVEESWWPLTESEQASGDVGLLVHVGVAGSRQGEADGGVLIVGIGEGTPTAVEQYTAVGAVPAASGGDVLVPRNLIGADTYLVLAPGWAASEGFYRCAEDISNPCSGPVAGGEGGSGQCAVPSITADWQELCDTGYTVWVAGSGSINGTNRTFTLIDWNGTGVPMARVGAVILAPGVDYSYSTSAKTVTLNEPPPTGSAVGFRYYAVP